jgi:hypothetical protein
MRPSGSVAHLTPGRGTPSRVTTPSGRSRAAVPGRMMQRKTGLFPPQGSPQQAWATPSGEGKGSTLSCSTGRHASFASISSCLVSGFRRNGTGRQSRPPQHSTPVGERSPVYQSCAPPREGAAVAMHITVKICKRMSVSLRDNFGRRAVQEQLKLLVQLAKAIARPVSGHLPDRTNGNPAKCLPQRWTSAAAQPEHREIATGASNSYGPRNSYSTKPFWILAMTLRSVYCRVRKPMAAKLLRAVPISGPRHVSANHNRSTDGSHLENSSQTGILRRSDPRLDARAGWRWIRRRSSPGSSDAALPANNMLSGRSPRTQCQARQ